MPNNNGLLRKTIPEMGHLEANLTEFRGMI